MHVYDCTCTYLRRLKIAYTLHTYNKKLFLKSRKEQTNETFAICLLP